MSSPTWAERLAGFAVALLGAAGLAGCGGHAVTPPPPATDSGLPAELVAQARPIGRGPRIHPGVTGPVVGVCRPGLGRRIGIHVELFGANRVVLVGQGIGTAAPRRLFAGRVAAARCYGALVTLDPTGVVYMRPGTRAVLADLFRSWGQPLTPQRLAGFAGRVTVFVNGAPRPGDPRRVPLRPHDEIVLEVGPACHRTTATPSRRTADRVSVHELRYLLAYGSHASVALSTKAALLVIAMAIASGNLLSSRPGLIAARERPDRGEGAARLLRGLISGEAVIVLGVVFVAALLSGAGR